MMQRWGPDAIRFMTDASEYGSFYQTLTNTILPYLPKDGHICDAGCGLGYLAQHLAQECKQVTAIDKAESAIAELSKRALPSNLTVLCRDIFTLKAEFDAMIFCYFGRMDEILHLAKKLCKDRVLIIKRECSEHKFSLGTVEQRKHTTERAAQTLHKLNIPFEQEQLSIEFGQPFRSIEDAVSFFCLYNKSAEPVTNDIVRERLILTGDTNYPFYLPSQRKMELIVFSANDIPKECVLL